MVQHNTVSGLACQELYCRGPQTVNPLHPQARQLQIYLYENLKEKGSFGLGKYKTAAICRYVQATRAVVLNLF